MFLLIVTNLILICRWSYLSDRFFLHLIFQISWFYSKCQIIQVQWQYLYLFFLKLNILIILFFIWKLKLNSNNWQIQQTTKYHTSLFDIKISIIAKIKKNKNKKNLHRGFNYLHIKFHIKKGLKKIKRHYRKLASIPRYGMMSDNTRFLPFTDVLNV